MLKEKGWLILPDSMLRINFDIISVFLSLESIIGLGVFFIVENIYFL